MIYAADVTSLHGTWTQGERSDGRGRHQADEPRRRRRRARALRWPNPTNYFDVSFPALGGTRYRVWLRIHAIGDSKWNDSVFVQFSDSVDDSRARRSIASAPPPRLMINLWTCGDCQSFGWGWQRNAYWLADTGDVWFQNSGTHTLRVQIREDGVEIDQIVISPTTYATNAPGPVSNDTTIVPKPTSGPAAPGRPESGQTAQPASAQPNADWTAPGATSYDVSFGTTNPPPLVVSGSSSASYTPPALTNATTYFWQVVARNSAGATTGLSGRSRRWRRRRRRRARRPG